MPSLLRSLTFLWVVCALFASVALTGCTTDDADDRLRVVATTNVVGDLVREIGGEEVHLTTLMGPGIDPHQYNASEGDVQRMAQADWVVYNGLHLEGKMTDVFAEMDRRGVPTTALAETSIPDSLLIRSTEFEGSYDPHVWFDASLWRRAALHVGERLAELDPDNAERYTERAVDYAERLDALHEEVGEQIQQIPEEQRVLVTSHDAFQYLGDAYGLEVRGLQGISTATEAGTADVRALARFVEEQRIPMLFAETSVSERGIRAVQEAVRDRSFDINISDALYGDALGDADTPTGTYEGAMRHNIDIIVRGLSGDLPEAA